jgi:hypothetical protein
VVDSREAYQIEYKNKRLARFGLQVFFVFKMLGTHGTPQQKNWSLCSRRDADSRNGKKRESGKRNIVMPSIISLNKKLHHQERKLARISSGKHC